MFGNWLISNFFSSDTVFKLLAPLTTFASFIFKFTSFAKFKPFPTSWFKNYINESLKSKRVGFLKGWLGWWWYRFDPNSPP